VRDRKVIDKVRVARVAAKVLFGVALSLSAVLPVSAQVPLGPDAAACMSGANDTALLIHLGDLKDRNGLLRITTYRAIKTDWLVKGRYTRRIDMPMPASGDVDICVRLPGPGRYGFGVLHDRNSDHKASPFSDGGGYSNDPHLSVFHLRPSVDEVAFEAGPGITRVNVKVNYL
jgi:uncharacterized protein (DUF2141 family)